MIRAEIKVLISLSSCHSFVASERLLQAEALPKYFFFARSRPTRYNTVQYNTYLVTPRGVFSAILK